MIVLYNIFQLLVLLIAWPALLVALLAKPKYRQSVPRRLGFGLQKLLKPARFKQKSVWIHALSVGEVASARPLVTGLRKEFPEVRIIFSVSTRTGLKMATQHFTTLVDRVIPSPLDFKPTVDWYIRLIHPDLFVLVETDFWPNLLHALRREKIPAILVNGRISDTSLSSYRRVAFFFKPLFQSFSHLCMQTESDRKNMEIFEVSPELVHCLGNLKFDTPTRNRISANELSKFIPSPSRIFLAGSTHEGEEDIILSVYGILKKRFSDLFLIIAPRDPERRLEISRMATARNVSWSYRSEQQNRTRTQDLLILDTLGELPDVYALADIAFVGGSLVNEGGHNPIEPAAAGIPVLFGPHMEDFAEISQDLLQIGGAALVNNQSALQQTLESLLLSDSQRKKMGQQAQACIARQRGVVSRHLEIFRAYL